MLYNLDTISTPLALDPHLASIEIFIGNPLEHASEQATLKCACEFLVAQGIPAIILANINVGVRQIDLVICFNQHVLVVEAKGLSAPVRGAENGHWHVRLASGRWKEIPNAYGQTLAEKMTLRDAMATFCGKAVPYPDASLIFVPAVPADSVIPNGDYKVSIAGLDGLSEQIQNASVKLGGWPLHQWRAFAASLGLISVSSIDAALSPKLLDAEHLLAVYSESFERTYGPVASTMVPTSCICENQTLSSANLLERTTLDKNVLLTGDSGYGKSLLSYALAVTALGYGYVPIVIPARDFEGNLRDVANREAALLGAQSAAAVISASLLLDRKLILLVDGYNECTPLEQHRLTRSIAAALNRYGATALISSRTALERNDLLPASIYALQAPDTATKRAIAQQAAGGISVETFSDLLGSVRSGLESRIIGQLGQNLPTGSSKYGLFDAYVRMRLGPSATDGIRALSRVAALMAERISFSMSIRELDRLLDREGVSGCLLHELLATNILERRGDRISFCHEMFLNVFSAEAIIRRTGEDPDAVVETLRLPQYFDMKPFVLGAIEETSFLRRILPSLSDSRLMRACLDGQCGSDAQLWANERCDEVLTAIGEEIGTIRFRVSEEFRFSIQPKPETLKKWTVEDRSVLGAIPHELIAGRRLDEVLKLIGEMDKRIADEHQRLLDEVKNRNVSLLRTGLYAAVYAGIGDHGIGLNQICGPISSGHLYGGPKVAASAELHERLRCETLSPGQVGLLVELDRYSDDSAQSLGRILPAILRRLWPRAAHHLQLGLMHAAGMCAGELNDSERHVLIDTIETLLPVGGGLDSTGMIDALKYLGALDDDQSEQVAGIKAQIQAVLAEPDDVMAKDAAAGLWTAQFDHPYDGAYCAAWNDLTIENRKLLMQMALQSIERDSMFAPPLIAEVASYADPSVAPFFVRWTALPAKKVVMAAEAIHTFQLAYAAFGRLHCPLPDASPDAVLPADEALLACGQILYWLNRDDLPQTERKSKCVGPLAILLRHDTGVAATVVGEFFHSRFMFSESAKYLPGSEPVITWFGCDFPEEVVAIYRSALEHPTSQTGYFEFFRLEDTIEKALSFIGCFGNKSDIQLLRIWSLHPDHGQSAVRAIKAINESSRHPK